MSGFVPLLGRALYYLERASIPGARFAGGDSFEEFSARVLAEFQRVLRTPSWSRLLLVAHGAVNRVILSYLVSGSCQRALSLLANFEQDPCCMNILDIDMVGDKVERSFLRAVNLTPYDLSKSQGNRMKKLAGDK